MYLVLRHSIFTNRLLKKIECGHHKIKLVLARTDVYKRNSVRFFLQQCIEYGLLEQQF